MRVTIRKGRIKALLALTGGLLAAGVIAGAPQALAEPGDVGDASLWRTSPKCSQPEDIILKAEGVGVMEFEYRVVGGETTTHRSRPPIQEPLPHHISAAIGERQIVWRAVARNTNEIEWPGGPDHADIETVDAYCGVPSRGMHGS